MSNSVNITGQAQYARKAQTKAGSSMLSLTLKSGGQNVEKGFFVKVIAFSEVAESPIKDGDFLFVSGRLKNDSYKDKTGKWVSQLCIVATEIEILSALQQDAPQTIANDSVGSGSEYIDCRSDSIEIPDYKEPSVEHHETAEGQAKKEDDDDFDSLPF